MIGKAVPSRAETIDAGYFHYSGNVDKGGIMDLNTAANALRELGHQTRLSIYRELVAGHEGLRLANCRNTLRFLPPRSAIIFQR
jgi:hypothetical protein